MKNKSVLIYLSAIFLCVVSIFLSFIFGAAKLSFSDLYHAICSGPKDTAGYIFWYARFPRTIACILAGAGLSCSGCIIQKVLNNQLASPGIIGVNAGAGFFVTICCAFGFLSGWIITLSAFAGAMLAVLLVVFLSKKIGASRTSVILSGIAVNSILNALSEAITTLLPTIAMLNTEFKIGGFSSIVHTRLLPAGLLILVSLLLVFTLHNELDLLSLGEDTAKSLGMNVKKIRTLLLFLAAMLAGASVSFCGLLGFVGLIIPHAARRLIGNESGKLLPLCALCGAGFVTLCDLISRLLFAPHELPVGILLSILGGPFFLFILLNDVGNKNIGHRL